MYKNSKKIINEKIVPFSIIVSDQTNNKKGETIFMYINKITKQESLPLSIEENRKQVNEKNKFPIHLFIILGLFGQPLIY
ncbi:hypothetical protein CD30_03740 [Ureibacillus massiliensis 4400831 = CIP 108448 = CCUG 49529]|uniref:Uncharacterized protein n=1 Tax=Ureibacillus massiliensis 4400831 = CIP 108448 = CCUG 49529 TaxID=1211035 RepID=A0A0A3J7G3_9BACL|nr:hypothetical protein CD30_03740 [Ureibacillus massiliensis 4400831 = CIP 108448 = CCUG 49529]